MIVLIILSILVGATVFTINIEAQEKGTKFLTAIVLWMTGYACGCFILYKVFIGNGQPSALDVYRDKTELKITSVNGVPNDTVVVFKVRNCE